MWKKGKTIDDAVEIGVEEGILYKLNGHIYSTLETNTINPCELWHRRLAHIHYKDLPIVSKVVSGIPKIQIDCEVMCKRCAQGKDTKNPFALLSLFG